MLNISTKDSIPKGFKLRGILRGHVSGINQITWSPDGKTLCSTSNDGTIKFWDFSTEQEFAEISLGIVFCATWAPDGHNLALGTPSGIVIYRSSTGETKRIGQERVNSLSWSPDGQFLAFSTGNIIQILHVKTGHTLNYVMEHLDEVSTVAWSPNGSILASGSLDCSIKLWNTRGQLLNVLLGHAKMIHSIAWSPDGEVLASGSSDATIRLWHSSTGRLGNIIEGHTGSVIYVSFSSGGYLLASKSRDGTVRCWRTDTLVPVAILEERPSKGWNTSLAFHPKASILATLGDEDRSIRIWELTPTDLMGEILARQSVFYVNAKVVLVGDTGVGKSALSLVLSGKQFVPTDSTHGRNVSVFDNKEIENSSGKKATRETLLWDLAGQPGYRLVHQLHLNEVAVALVVFDARSETDPFAGVGYWIRALRQIQHIQGDSAPPMKIFLVAARVDRSGQIVSPGRIRALMDELSIDGYFETSAKEGNNIERLSHAIREAIVWEALPQVSSTDLFQRIRNFLTMEQKGERYLSKEDDLYRMFLSTSPRLNDVKDLTAQFKTCVGRLEARGLIRQLSFGDLILLQPEMLDVYASALVNAVKDEPDGLGSISEEKARKGAFFIPEDQRLSNKEQEKLLLIAVVENLLRYEIVLREYADDGPYLVFPSQTTRENPYQDALDIEEKQVEFSFEGPVLNIYTTLAVRLSHSGIFKMKNFWKNAFVFTAKSGGSYGFYFNNVGEGRGELALFFDEKSTQDMCFLFEDYVQSHLLRRAIPASIKRRRIFMCTRCKTSFTELQVMRRREMGKDWIQCSVCDTIVTLFEDGNRQRISPQIYNMDQNANERRDTDATSFIRDSLSTQQYKKEELKLNLPTVTAILEAKRKKGDFDVYLSYNPIDALEVKEIGKLLKENGILPWLDEWELQPGMPWQPSLERLIKRIKSAAVFIGRGDTAPWQEMATTALLREFIKRDCPVIPVLLTTTTDQPAKVPMFLEGMTWVDFRKQDPDPLKHLIFGITGKRYSE